MIIFPDFII